MDKEVGSETDGPGWPAVLFRTKNDKTGRQGWLQDGTEK